MKHLNLLHTFFLTITVLFCVFWTSSPLLASFNLQLTGALVILYFASKMLSPRYQSSLSSGMPSMMILTTITLLLIFSTGSATSPLFFLLDFLLFALALFFQPLQSGIVAILLTSVFLWQNQAHLSPEILINLVSLLLISPLAILFGRNYLASLSQKGKITILTETLRQEEIDSFLWISTSARPPLSSILNSVTDLISYLGSKSEGSIQISTDLINKLKAIQADIYTLYASTNALESSIKKASDNIDTDD